ncbi:MAG: trehalose-phosphatase [Deltaproteobacteria bacterium]|jgi:trehalose 6-phosphate phosphatase|nr:trehalose-phosphatase [Deltaproteobacteria bacterium]
MNNIIESFTNVKRKIEHFNPDVLLLCIDFDGTLAKIQKNPYAAYLDIDHKKTIEKIADIEGIYYCIVTGRELKDIKKRVGISSNIIYSGNHGMEIESYYKDLKINFVAGGKQSGSFIKIVKKIEKDLRKIEIPGLIIENKKYSISLHCRMLSPENISKLKKETKEIIKSNKEYKALLHLKRGKKIVEVRPKFDWDKGKACNYITGKLAVMHDIKSGGNILNILRFSAGDDLTDETMFKDSRGAEYITTGANVLNMGSVVGKKKSNADYYLDNYSQTYIITEKIADLYRRLHNANGIYPKKR